MNRTKRRTAPTLTVPGTVLRFDRAPNEFKGKSVNSTVSDEAPVVLVGLPRSGSTLLTRILNTCPDTYVLNDLYILQQVDAFGCWDGFSDEDQANSIIAHIRHNVWFQSGIPAAERPEACARMNAEQLERALDAIDNGPIRKTHWAETIEDTIRVAAKAAGKKRWGWNTPQDYLHMDRILAVWPSARFIFNMRHPFNTLRSYKHYPTAKHRARYHPAAQSFAWRKAANAYRDAAARNPDHTLLVRYEDITGATASELTRINQFLGSGIDPAIDLAALGRNSSFTAGTTASSTKTGSAAIEPFECWLSDCLLYQQRKDLGFDDARSRFSLRGLGTTLKDSAVFAGAYGNLAITDKDVRKRIGRFLGKAS